MALHDRLEERAVGAGASRPSLPPAKSRCARSLNSSYADGIGSARPRASTSADVDGGAAVVARALGRIGDVARVGHERPHLLLHRQRAVAVVGDEAEAARGELARDVGEAARDRVLQEAARARVEPLVREVARGGVADVEAQARDDAGGVDEAGEDERRDHSAASSARRMTSMGAGLPVHSSSARAP